MVNKFILSSNAILNEINKDKNVLSDLKLTEYDLLSIIVEYIEINSQTPDKKSLSDYLSENWLIKDELLPSIIKIANSVLMKLVVISPELIDILNKTNGLSISHYDDRIFVLERINRSAE